MKLIGLLLAVMILLFGARLLITAGQAALTGRVLVRRGFRTQWEPAVTHQEALQIAFKNGLMGLLLLILGIAIITP